MKEGFDIGLEMSGAPKAVAEMLDNMNHGGRIAMLGLPASDYAINWGRVITHMLTIKGIYGREMFETWNAMAAMLSSSTWLHGAISSVITDVIPVLGMVDDVVIVPAAIAALMRLLPYGVRSDCERQADYILKHAKLAGVLVTLFLLAWVGVVVWGIYKLVS